MGWKRFSCFLLVGLALFAWSNAGAYETFLGPTGVIKWDKAKAYDGYTLFVPNGGTNIYLIDMDGNVVHEWDTPYINDEYAVLLPNGNVLRGACLPESEPLAVYFGGSAGLLQELSWDNKVVWQYKLNSPKGIHHHAFDRMPNGDTLLLAWENHTWSEAIAKGRDPRTIYADGPVSPMDPKKQKVQGIWSDMIQEVDKDGKVVWEWHVWDHIGNGPNQININYVLPVNLAGQGDIMSGPDWTHGNTVEYLPEKDQVIFNSRNFSEFFMIDKKTGNIVYRWGNPSTHGAGRAPAGYSDDGDQILFGEHNVHMLPNGNITLFDNGTSRPSGNYSRAIEMDPKTGKILWQFASNGAPAQANSFYSPFQGGVQKLPNGNYLIASTHGGHVFEVTPDKKVVWEFENPIGDKNKVFCTREDFSQEFFVHRAYRYGKDYQGLQGKELTPQHKINPGCPDFRAIYEEATAKNQK